jgi:hypothetical protein
MPDAIPLLILVGIVVYALRYPKWLKWTVPIVGIGLIAVLWHPTTEEDRRSVDVILILGAFVWGQLRNDQQLENMAKKLEELDKRICKELQSAERFDEMSDLAERLQGGLEVLRGELTRAMDEEVSLRRNIDANLDAIQKKLDNFRKQPNHEQYEFEQRLEDRLNMIGDKLSIAIDGDPPIEKGIPTKLDEIQEAIDVLVQRKR